jgi:hypothetical protein
MSVTITTVKPKMDRVPSSIQFPYSDMSDAIAVAEGLLKGGGVALTRDQLAAAMGLAPGGGGFATKISTARIFGVVDSTSGKYQLTELGFEIVDPGRQTDAKVKAFLNVELYKRTYDEFRGKLLPPRPHGLERAFVNFGVTEKNARHARLAFEKSARLAGMYPGGNEDRLVMPFGNLVTATPEENRTPPDFGVTAIPSMPPAPATPLAKPLEYELIDLLKSDGIGEPESEAIWTLVRFLTGKKKTRPADGSDLA